jgi:2-polyprenyl-3-methyl-5-hydroxy-6-metoxy-1,4-benzoquinol methylase
VKCKNCGLVYTLENLSNDKLMQYYDKDYYEGKVYTSYENEEAQRKRYYIQQLLTFENFDNSRKGRILELGSATGSFLDCARYFGYEAVGTEKSEYSANVARTKKHEVYTKDIDVLVKEGILAKGSFDAVFMWDVFEHLNYPFQTLKYVNYVTRNGGLLTINTLNISSPTVKYLGKEWSHFAPPQHLFYYTLKTMNMYLRKNGYTTLRLRTAGPLFYDDLKDKYYILKKLFSNQKIQRITNRLNLGYAQLIIAKKTNEV